MSLGPAEGHRWDKPTPPPPAGLTQEASTAGGDEGAATGAPVDGAGGLQHDGVPGHCHHG